MNTLDVLKAARELIAKPENWVQGPFAVNAAGEPVFPFDHDACAFCAIGATWRAAPNKDLSAAADYELEKTLGDLLANQFSDAEGRTHDEVLDLFDRTIARLESEARA